MQTDKHTPGPWKAIDLDSFPSIVSEQGKGWNNPVVCDLFEDVTPPDSVTIGAWLRAYGEAGANARLIAEAPAMLEALRVCQEALDVLAEDAVEAGYPARADEATELAMNIRAILARIDGN